jgi:hypothetical protein
VHIEANLIDTSSDFIRDISGSNLTRDNGGTKKLRRTVYVARMAEKRNAYRILVEKPQGTRRLGGKIII